MSLIAVTSHHWQQCKLVLFTHLLVYTNVTDCCHKSSLSISLLTEKTCTVYASVGLYQCHKASLPKSLITLKTCTVLVNLLAYINVTDCCHKPSLQIFISTHILLKTNLASYICDALCLLKHILSVFLFI